MSDRRERTDRFTAVEDEYAGYTVRDLNGEKIGKVDNLFLDENDNPEYVGVKMGFFGTKGTLVPLDACTVDNSQGFIEVNQPKQAVKNAPSFDDDGQITPDYERRVREHYGLSASEERGSHGAYQPGRTGNSDAGADGDAGRVGPGMVEGDNEGGRQREGSNLEDEDELRVQRTEEELRAGVREREAGQVNVRKSVRTERERIAVPKRREEVSVERVAVDEPASEGLIGEAEVSVPVVEEEVVVDKRAVVKEEIRVRKDVVEDEEIVEADVRKEEIDIDEASGASGRRDR